MIIVDQNQNLFCGKAKSQEMIFSKPNMSTPKKPLLTLNKNWSELVPSLCLFALWFHNFAVFLYLPHLSFSSLQRVTIRSYSLTKPRHHPQTELSSTLMVVVMILLKANYLGFDSLSAHHVRKQCCHLSKLFRDFQFLLLVNTWMSKRLDPLPSREVIGSNRNIIYRNSKQLPHSTGYRVTY